MLKITENVYLNEDYVTGLIVQPYIEKEGGEEKGFCVAAVMLDRSKIILSKNDSEALAQKSVHNWNSEIQRLKRERQPTSR